MVKTAGLVQADVAAGSLNRILSDTDWRQLVPIALLSFQYAGQIVANHHLALSEILTVVVTSLSCDRGPIIKILNNLARSRRALAFLGVRSGAISGAG